MFGMFKKVSAKERIVGFYSSGPNVKNNDLKIYDLVSKFHANPIFCIVDVRADLKAIPTTAYKAVSLVSDDGCDRVMSFAHIPSAVGALEAEEVGVEHLLRDINDPTVSTVANQIKSKVGALTTLVTKLKEMQNYLNMVIEGKLQPNQKILGNLQAIFNLLPNLNVESLVTSILSKTNDLHIAMYISSLVRAVISLHELVENKIMFLGEEEKSLNGGLESEDKKEEGKEKKEEKKGDKA